MTDLSVINHPEDNALIVDSRLITKELNMTHRSFMETVRKYQKQTEKAFENLRFETETATNSVGNPQQDKRIEED